MYAVDIFAPGETGPIGTLAMMNLNNGMTKEFSEIVILYPSGHNTFSVTWSQDSSAFYIYTSNGPATRLYYAQGLSDLETITFLTLRDDTKDFGAQVEEIGRIDQVLDIDPTGQFLLAERSLHPQETGKEAWEHQLLLLDMKKSTATVLESLVSSVQVAELTSDDKIYFINREGLFLHKRSDGTSQLLNAEINSKSVLKAHVSPDGTHIAVIDYRFLGVQLIPIKS